MFFAWNFHVISMHIFSGDVCLNASFLNLIFELKIIVTRSTRPFKVYQAQPKDEYCSIIRGKWLWMAMSTENKTSNWRHAWLHQSWALKLALNPFFDSRPLRLTPFLLVSSTLSHLIILILYFHSSHYKTLKSNFGWRLEKIWDLDHWVTRPKKFIEADTETFFETKIFETETFFRDQIFSRPILRLFFGRSDTFIDKE